MRFFVTCAKGTEGALRRELAAARVPHVKGDRGGVTFEGRLEAGMRACLWSRVGMRVLMEVGSFDAPGADALYEGARALPWRDLLTERTTLAVEATVRDSQLTHSHYAALKLKDAAVDALREALGTRPNVDPKNPDVRIVLHLARDRATVSLDLAGEPLHRRGYRVAMTEAPLKETLAAAVLSLGGVDPALPFVDPMCGSGTLAIEHALMARKLAPGLGRAFGFQRWPMYRGGPQSSWDRMKEEARQGALPAAPAPILARDRFEKALDAARRNAHAAGVDGDLAFELGDVRELDRRWPRATFCTNPPYGERLGQGRLQLEGLYRGMAEAIHRLEGWDVVLLSGSPLLERALKMKAQVSHKLWNGPLEVRLLRYHVAGVDEQ